MKTVIRKITSWLMIVTVMCMLCACAHVDVNNQSTTAEHSNTEHSNIEKQTSNKNLVNDNTIEEPTSEEPTSEKSISEDPAYEVETVEDQTETVSIIMVGDLLLHTPVEESCRFDDGTYDYSSLFEHTSSMIEEADLAIINEEVIIGGEELGVSGYPAFNAPFEVADALSDVGFDVVLHATNHALDKGGKGIMSCLTYWDMYHPDVAVLGIHDSDDDSQVINTFEIHGITIAILNYTYGTNGINLPENMPFAVDLMSEERVTSDIERAKEIADFVIVCPHWGTEYRLSPDEYQKKWTKIFLDNGVDLVIGTHPHVIEPVEMIVDEETGDEMLVYYSLGNYVNWTSGTGEGIANRMVGGMARVTISKDDDGEVDIAAYGLNALVTDLHEGMGGVSVYPLSEYTEDMADTNAIRNQDPQFTYEYCIELCNTVWPNMWE